MNRKRLFRVWHEPSKTMQIFTLGENYLKFYANSEKWTIEDVNDHPVMDSTGFLLKDKLVFEGDILGGYPHGTATVEWDEKIGCFMAVSYNDVVDEAGNDSTEKEVSVLSHELENCKDAWDIIGHRYKTGQATEAKPLL